MIAYVCACGHHGKAEDGQPKTCNSCGAIVTLGAVAKAHPLTMDRAKKAVLAWLGQGPDAPMLTGRQIDDRRKLMRITLDGYGIANMSAMKQADLPRLLDQLGIRA